MDNPALYRRVMLLAVLLAPLGFALACAVTRGSARRLAAGFAFVHVLLTAGLVGLTVGALIDRGGTVRDYNPPIWFEPLGVPGDPSPVSDQDGYETAWTLLELAPTVPGLPPAAVQLFLGLDGFNVWLVALASVMTLVAVMAAWRFDPARRAGFLAWLFALQFAVTGAFLAFDVVLFYVFFELTLIPAFFLIGRYGVGGGRREAARTFVLYTLFGSLLTLAGLVGLVLTNPTPLSPYSDGPKPAYTIVAGRDGEPVWPKAGPITFSLPKLTRNVAVWALAADTAAARSAARLAAAGPDTPPAAADRLAAEATAAAAARDRRLATQLGLFVLLVAGFAVKTPIVPFHSWLPAAYAEAPLAATLLFSAVLAKLGTYGLLRLVLPLCPDACVAYGLPVFGTLGAVGIVYAALCAYAQRDLKLLAAYSSVSHLGFLVVGLFALNAEGIVGASLHMVNHGLTAGGLFAVLAVLHDRYRTTDVNAVGGLAARLPGFAVLTTVLCLAGIGLPGLNSFVSEMLMLAALFDPVNRPLGGYTLAAVAAAGLFLSAWYVISMLRRVLFGPLREPTTDAALAAPGLTRPEGVALALPAVLCLVLGLFPQPVLDSMKMEAAVVANQLRLARVRAGQMPAMPTAPPRAAPAPPPGGPGRGGRPPGGDGPVAKFPSP